MSADFSLARSISARCSRWERRARACSCAAATWCVKSGSSPKVQGGAGRTYRRAGASRCRLPLASAGASRGSCVESFCISGCKLSYNATCDGVMETHRVNSTVRCDSPRSLEVERCTWCSVAVAVGESNGSHARHLPSFFAELG